MKKINCLLMFCAALLMESTCMAQWEMAYGSPTSTDQAARTKGDAIEWLGDDCYISARRDCSPGVRCYTVFHIVDKNGCETVQSAATASITGFANNVFVTSVKNAGPNRFVYTGYRTYQGTCETEANLVIGHYDASGVNTWIKEFGEEGTREIGNDLIIDSDGNIVVTGYAETIECGTQTRNYYQNRYLLMAKFDITGYPTLDGGVQLYREDQAVTSSWPNYTRHFAFTANSIIEQDNPELSPEKPWTKEYVVAGLMEANAEQAIPGADYDAAFVMRIQHDITTPQLDIRKRFPFTNDSEGFDLELMDNGRIIIAGVVSGLSGNLGADDAFLVDIQPDLKTNWMGMNYNIFGSTGDEEARSIVFDGVQSYYVSGNTSSFSSNVDIFLFRGTFNGNGDLQIQSRPFPNLGTVGLFGGSKEEYNHNIVFDERNGAYALHLFNSRGSMAAEQYPDYRVHTNIYSLATECDDYADFSVYDEGINISTNGFTYEGDSRDEIGNLLNGMVQMASLDICNGCSTGKTDPDSKTDEASVGVARLSVFPNPSIDELNIQTTESIQGIVIMDASGRTVLEATSDGSNVEVLNLKGLTSGIYFVQITTDVSVETVEIIKE